MNDTPDKRQDVTEVDGGTEHDDRGQHDSVAEAIDFTSEVTRTPARSKEITEKPYDPRPHEDGARRNIAYALIGLLAFIVLAMVLLGCGTIAVKDLKEFAVVLGPVVALVSAATGFYYGTKSSGG